MSRDHTTELSALRHSTHYFPTSAKRQVGTARASDQHMPLEPWIYACHFHYCATILCQLAAEGIETANKGQLLHLEYQVRYHYHPVL